MEVSLCNAAANRRVFGLYKSQTKPEGDPLEDIEKGGPGSGPQKGDGGGKDAGVGETAAKLAAEHGKKFDAAHARGDKTAAAEHARTANYHEGIAQQHGFTGSNGKAERLAKGGPGSGPQKGDGGDKKAATRKADELHAKAHDLSQEAHKTNEVSDHRAATEAHREAGDAARAIGDKVTAKISESAANYHSRQAEKLDGLEKSQVGTPMNIQDAISNTDPQILKALGAVAKSVGSQDGRSYTPQAASIIKAVGRLLAPFAEELTLSDLQAVGKAAGLGATAGGDDSEAAPAFKSVAKPGDDEDELEDDADSQAPDGDDVSDDEEVEDEDEQDDEEDEETEEEAAKSARTIAAGGELAQGISKSKAEDESEEDEDEEDDDDEDEDSSGENKAPPFGQPKGAKAKGGKMAKAAQAGQSVDARFEEIMAKHRQLAEENKVLREGLSKSRVDLDAERDYRQLEAIKKSIREDFGHLGLDEAKFAPVLKRAKDADDQAHYQELTSLLKSCNDKVRGAQAAGGIFEAVGKSSPGAQGGATWSDRIEARVDEEMKKSAHGAVRAVVYDQFIQTAEGREMRKNHRLEKGRI